MSARKQREVIRDGDRQEFKVKHENHGVVQLVGASSLLFFCPGNLGKLHLKSLQP